MIEIHDLEIISIEWVPDCYFDFTLLGITTFSGYGALLGFHWSEDGFGGYFMFWSLIKQVYEDWQERRATNGS